MTDIEHSITSRFKPTMVLL